MTRNVKRVQIAGSWCGLSARRRFALDKKRSLCIVRRMSSPPNRIAQLREASGLLRVDVAAKLRVGEVTVVRWENGTSGVPDRHKLALAEMFGVSVIWLMGWEDHGSNGGSGESEEDAA